MVQAAQEQGARIRFDTEYLSLTQDVDGVTAPVRDRLIGTDTRSARSTSSAPTAAAARSPSRSGLPFEGPMGAVGSSMNIVFEADLSQFVAHRPRSSTGCSSPGPTSGASAWACCAWSGPGTSG